MTKFVNWEEKFPINFVELNIDVQDEVVEKLIIETGISYCLPNDYPWAEDIKQNKFTQRPS